ncbi:hypothetical protein ACFLSA_02640 [Bacteroidota bacterium]
MQFFIPSYKFYLVGVLGFGIFLFTASFTSSQSLYKLKLKEVNGTELSDSIIELNSTNLSLYLNPAKNILTINLKNEYNGKIIISIYSLIGEELSRVELNKIERQLTSSL